MNTEEISKNNFYVIFRDCLDQGVFLDVWKKAEIVAVFKKIVSD